MRRISFAKTYLTAIHAVSPTVHLGGIALAQGETSYELPPNTDSANLVLTELTIKTRQVLDECALGRQSKLAVIVDLECPGFDLRTMLFREVLDPELEQVSFSGVPVAEIPSSIISAGFSTRVGLIAVDPVRTSPVGCATRGGVLDSWESTVPPRTRTVKFPIEESADEPSLWRLEVMVDDINDLDRPARAALRLFVDSARLGTLFGADVEPTKQDEAIAWLRTEAMTSIVTHVLMNRTLREHFSNWLLRNPPIENDLDPRSIGYHLVVLLGKTIGSDLNDWYESFLAEPVKTTRDLRAKFGVNPNANSTKQRTAPVSR